MSSYGDIITETYISPIRNVLLIDDMFPTLNNFFNDNKKELYSNHFKTLFSVFQNYH